MIGGVDASDAAASGIRIAAVTGRGWTRMGNLRDWEVESARSFAGGPSENRKGRKAARRLRSSCASGGLHAAESEMIRAGAALALATRADCVTRAVFGGAEEGSAPVHGLGRARLAGIEGILGTGRVARNPAGCGQPGVVVAAIPGAHP